jgi:hypothetical protein
MRETPTDGEDNEVLEALKSLIFEGEGDGASTFAFAFYSQVRLCSSSKADARYRSRY